VAFVQYATFMPSNPDVPGVTTADEVFEGMASALLVLLAGEPDAQRRHLRFRRTIYFLETRWLETCDAWNAPQADKGATH
jgi:hypothetical protein